MNLIVLTEQSQKFSFLIQCQRHIEATAANESSQPYSARIQKACRGYLSWAFQIVQFTDTWAYAYAIDGTPQDETKIYDYGMHSPSRSIDGATELLKLCLYLSTWQDEWEFVLELLHSKLSGWLQYLTDTQHLSHLWIESYDFVKSKPRDTGVRDAEYIDHKYPTYDLADFELLWLALIQTENLIKDIEESHDLAKQQLKKSLAPVIKKYLDYMINDVRRSWDTFQEKISIQTIQNNIHKTFKTSVRDLTTRTITEMKSPVESLKPSSDGFKTSSPVRAEKRMVRLSEQNAYRKDQAVGPLAEDTSHAVIAFDRSITEYGLELPISTIPIEAAMKGFFKGQDDRIETAWQNTLKMQSSRQTGSIRKPLETAFVLWAAKAGLKLINDPTGVDHEKLQQTLRTSIYQSGLFADVREVEEDKSMSRYDLRDWSVETYKVTSFLLGVLYEECRLR